MPEDPNPPSDRPEDWAREFYTLEIDPRKRFEHLLTIHVTNPYRNQPQSIPLDINGLFFLDVAQAEQQMRSSNSEFISQFAERPYVVFPPVEGLKEVPYVCVKVEEPE